MEKKRFIVQVQNPGEVKWHNVTIVAYVVSILSEREVLVDDTRIEFAGPVLELFEDKKLTPKTMLLVKKIWTTPYGNYINTKGTVEYWAYKLRKTPYELIENIETIPEISSYFTIVNE